MKLRSLLLAAMLVASAAGQSRAAYGVRISDLENTPVPPNPVRIWGKVTGESPLKVSDGRAEVTVTGRTASLGEYLALDGWWNGQFFSVAPIEMVYIPAGSFLMGNNGSEPYSYSFELPQHSVYLSGYHIGKYEVTRGEYAQFKAVGGYSNPAYWSTAGWSWKVSNSRTEPVFWGAVQDWGDGSFTQTNNHPVVGVSYYEAAAFCNWAGGHLPTEAQWEKAARWTGIHPSAFPWGDTWDAQKCNNWDDSLYPGWQTAPVGSYPGGVSPYGLHDMAGNVLEWCKDWYGANCYSETPPGGWIDPQGPISGTSRVQRGGGWEPYDYCVCRCAYRFGVGPGAHGFSCGFRLAR